METSMINKAMPTEVTTSNEAKPGLLLCVRLAGLVMNRFIVVLLLSR